MPSCRRSVASDSCRGVQHPDGVLRDLTSVVRHFVDDSRHRRHEERGFYAGQPDIVAAIRAAALRRPGGPGVPDHQRRAGRRALERAADVLVRHRHALAACEAFAPLHDLVAEKIGHLPRIGSLHVYDIAERIGCWLGIEPDRVYLHAGALEGARALGLSGATLAVSDLPRAFHCLTPGESEDCLCRYKDVLRVIGAGALRR